MIAQPTRQVVGEWPWAGMTGTVYVNECSTNRTGYQAVCAALGACFHIQRCRPTGLDQATRQHPEGKTHCLCPSCDTASCCDVLSCMYLY